MSSSEQYTGYVLHILYYYIIYVYGETVWECVTNHLASPAAREQTSCVSCFHTFGPTVQLTSLITANAGNSPFYAHSVRLYEMFKFTHWSSFLDIQQTWNLKCWNLFISPRQVRDLLGGLLKPSTDSIRFLFSKYSMFWFG
jgi:hypothetical protein